MTRDYLIEQISEKTGVNEKEVEIFIDNVADALDSHDLGFTFDGLLGKVPGVVVSNLEYDKENTTVISQDYDEKLANQMGGISAEEVAIVTDFISENAEKYSDNILLNVLGEEVKSQFAQFADREYLTTSISSIIPEKETTKEEQISQETEEPKMTKEEALEKWNELKEKFDSIFDDIKENFENSTFGKLIEEGREKIGNVMDEIRDRIEERAEDIKLNANEIPDFETFMAATGAVENAKNSGMDTIEVKQVAMGAEETAADTDDGINFNDLSFD